MRLEFTYTLDDLNEAARLVRFGAPTGRRWLKRPTTWIYLALFAVAIALNVYFAVRDGRSTPRAAQNTSFKDMALSFVPWVIIFLVIWFIIYRWLRGQGKEIWESNPAMQHPQAVDVDEFGLRMSSMLSTTHWQWSSFTGWGDTTNLLYLRLTSNTFLCIPKRAAATPAELDALRQVFRERVVGTDAAFPVLPASTAKQE